MKTKTMKLKILKPTGVFASALLLTLLTACGPAKTPVAETQEAATSAPPATAAAPVAAPEAATPPAAAAVATNATPAGAVVYTAQPSGSKMKIAGTSTLHDWTMESGIIGGSLTADAKFPESALTDPQAAKPTVIAFTPVKSFKSNSKKMDSSTYEYLKEPEFKKIEYKLLELKPKSAAGATGPLQFDAVGALTIVGVTRTNTMPVTIEKTGNKLKIVGSAPVKCTDYKLEPFRFLLISCGDDLTITFEWLLEQKAQ